MIPSFLDYDSACDALLGHRVRVYWNFNRKIWSVQKRERVNSVTPGWQTGRWGPWKVVAHVRELTLTRVEFKVSAAGRARVLRDRRKNVHAYVHGRVVKACARDLAYSERVRYNPYEMETFVWGSDDQPAHDADLVFFRSNGKVDARHPAR